MSIFLIRAVRFSSIALIFAVSSAVAALTAAERWRSTFISAPSAAVMTPVATASAILASAAFS